MGSPKRLAMFVDGWNMYWSLVGHKIRPYGWCDFKKLARQKLSEQGGAYHDAIVKVKFFTSEDLPHPEKINRQQKIWSMALTFTGCQIVWGEFRPTHVEVEEQLRDSGKRWREKQTDIALASHLIADCNQIAIDKTRSGAYSWSPGYDEAIVLSQDSDFIPAVKIVSELPFNRRVHVFLPPSEFRSQENAMRLWRPISGPTVVIHQLSKADYAKSLLPRVIPGPNGQSVTCYHTWMWREKYESENTGQSVASVADLQAKYPGRTQLPTCQKPA